MEVTTLTKLQYSGDREGPWQIYIFDRKGYHRGGKWFSKDMKYPDEEITIDRAHRMAIEATANALEVRVCDGGDELVFRSVKGKVIYGADFWKEIGAEK